ncbi:MAG: Do family serine endopeptidase [Gammaproteobacteria bacterium]|nr:Do family serine endopeptidase [Gammaproteobacteria bacterium]
MFKRTMLSRAIRSVISRPVTTAILLGAAVGATAVGVTGAAPGGGVPAPAAALMSVPGSFADLVERTRPAVVAIKTAGSAANPLPRLNPGLLPEHFRHFFRRHYGGPTHPVEGMGSGFIVDPNGLVVTNYHVVKDAETIVVVTYDGEELPAKVQGYDEKTDLALLKVEAKGDLAYVSFGDSDATRVGDWVVAVGNPFGLGGSYTAGIVSARGRNIQSGPYDDYLQIDAPINRGNSGGALFNVQGEVVGVNTAIYSPNGGNVGIGFAVPAKLASRVIAALRDDGQVERGWLGVRIQAISKTIAESMDLAGTDGALVVSVEPGSPAARAKLAPGDVIVGFGKDKVMSSRDLPWLVADAALGARIPLTVLRGGEELVIDVLLHKRADKGAVVSADADHGGGDGLAGEVLGGAPLGLELAPLTDAYRARLGWPVDKRGVVIAAVVPGSKAAKERLRPGMVIRMVGRVEVNSPAGVVAQVKAARAEKRRNVVFLVADGDGWAAFVALPLA